MVKITLYNIGEYKKKQVFYCFVGFFCTCCLCIPNMLKESKEDIYIWNIVYQCFVYSPYGYRHKCVSSSNLQRYPFSHTASTLYMNQSMMASPCKLNKNNFYVHVYKRTYYVNNILYIYIIYRNMKTIISKILNIRKKFLTFLFIYIIIIYVRKLTTTVGFIVMNFIVVISY